jgi:hypothetical protein
MVMVMMVLVMVIVMMLRCLSTFRRQFKDFHEREPTQVFGLVKGFYLRFIEDIPDACVKLWNVQHIGLSRKSRHLDRVAQKQVQL